MVGFGLVLSGARGGLVVGQCPPGGATLGAPRGQLASTWLRLYEQQDDPRYLNAAVKALAEVCRYQRLIPSRPNIHGAIAGSAPFYGAYMRFRYPNWAAKFFVDAMMELGASLAMLNSPLQEVAKKVA